MKGNKTIKGLREKYEALVPELRKALAAAIIETITRLSSGKGTLDLQEFHIEGYDDPATVLVEVDCHTGNQANETVDCIEVNKKGDRFWIDTENGGIDDLCISTEEMLAIYDELSFIEDHIFDPDCEFTVEDGKITLKNKR